VIDILSKFPDAKKTGNGWQVKCPVHEDRNPSLSINTGNDGRVLLHCFAGCAPEAICSAVGVKMADLFPDGGKSLPKSEERRQRPDARQFNRGTEAELQSLAEARPYGIEGLRLADKRGLLVFGKVCGFQCYLVKDCGGRLIEARRLDCEPFPAFKNLPARKAHTIRGSQKGWPLGIVEASEFEHIALVEGIPDFLHAHQLVYAEGAPQRVGVVAMLSASPKICEEALGLFKDKRVRLFPHVDRAGVESALRWCAQLKAAGATYDLFDLHSYKTSTGESVNDLCDLSKISADAFEEYRELWGVMP
jgi:hypothetical protein